MARSDQRHDDRSTAPETGPEVLGSASYTSGETKTCDQCGEETEAQRWEQTGPTYSRGNGQPSVQVCTMTRCPECGALQ